MSEPRHLEYAGEHVFCGKIARGLSGDNIGLQWGNAQVIVLGHGPYAVEQVRTALEHNAAHVMVLVRRHGLVCPAIVDHLNLVRPFTNKFEHATSGSGMMLDMWRQVYIGAPAQPPETWQRGVFRPDGHSVSVSDIYFVGHHGTKLLRMEGPTALRRA